VPVDEHTVERLHALLDEQSALRRVATLVAADPGPRRLFDTVCQELAILLGVESTDIIRYEDDGTGTVVGTWVADGAPSFPVGTSVPIDARTVTGKLFETGVPQRVDDYEGVPGELAARLRAGGIRAAVGAPIHVGGRIWGGIMSVAAEPNAFPADSEQRVAGFAELVTAALANADARAQLAASRARLVEVGDAERQRLERNLHDGAQQRLVSVALELTMAAGKLDRDPKAARVLLETAQADLARGLDELRELARGIHPAMLTERGLGVALDALAARAPLPVEVTGVPRERLAAPLEAAAYYVVAEGLANTHKHAGASKVEIRARADAEHLVIEVLDDGVGGADEEGTGLSGLADRIEAQGGVLALQSPPGGGTRLRARIPLT
jgi:signal transduction histidine kinase